MTELVKRPLVEWLPNIVKAVTVKLVCANLGSRACEIEEQVSRVESHHDLAGAFGNVFRGTRGCRSR
ncbi:MAG: hypothetical protein AAF989_16025 [Planctomycetota bacterium]